jgi:hypothetical protein
MENFTFHLSTLGIGGEDLLGNKFCGTAPSFLAMCDLY